MKIIKNIIILSMIFVFFLINIYILPNIVGANVNDGKVELNNGLMNREKFFESDQLLAPSQIATSKKIEIKNTGDLSLNLYEQFRVNLIKDGYSKNELDIMLNKYYIKPSFYQNDEFIQVDGLTDSWIKASEFNLIYDDVDKESLTTLGISESLAIKLDIKLDESADNKYQSAVFNVDFIISGVPISVLSLDETNNNDDVVGSELPRTATNIYKLVGIGILLLLTGGITLFIARKFPKGE